MKVLVIGDAIVDKYIYGTSTRISPEAPVPVVTYQNEKTTSGGAGLVYENLKSLGVDVTLFETEQPSSVKTRIICDGHYITRLDEDKLADGDQVYELVKATDFSEYDIVVLSDYNKGTLSRSRDIIYQINQYHCKVIVDPKDNAYHYHGAWLVKPNGAEFHKYHFTDWKENIIVTNAGESVRATIDGKHYEIPVEPVEVNDVTGAGDCFISAFVYALDKGYDYKKCIKVATSGSTESVKHSGTYILTEKDLQKGLIFTNGCFDVLHKGHLTLLKEARELGHKLIVGVNTDASIQRLKGSDRPINDVETRVAQLEILPWVDQVVTFEEDTPYEVIKELMPDLIVKGDDYTAEEVVGNDLAPVHILQSGTDLSTTEIIKKGYRMTQLKGIQEKGWGRELIWATTEKYCGKLMFFDNKGSKFSMHFHKEKDESWYVLNGSFSLYTMDTNTAEMKTQFLTKGETWRNEPMLPHQLVAMEDNSVIIEVSTPDSVEDNYRIGKGDSQS